MEKEVCTPVHQEDMALSENNLIKKEKGDEEDLKMGPNLTNGSAHSSPTRNDQETNKTECENQGKCNQASNEDANNINNINKLKGNNVDKEPNMELQQQKDIVEDPSSHNSNDACNENQEFAQNQDDIKKEENESTLQHVIDSKIPLSQENIAFPLTEIEKNSEGASVKNEISKEPNAEEQSTTENDPKSNSDIKVPEAENESSTNLFNSVTENTSFSESQQPQQESSQNVDNEPTKQITNQHDDQTSQNQYSELPSFLEANRCENNETRGSDNTQSFECNNETPDKLNEGQSLDDAGSANEATNQENGLEDKLSHEGITTTSETNLDESQTNNVISDKNEGYLNSQYPETTKENDNENMSETNFLATNLDTNIEHDHTSATDAMNDNNAASNYQEMSTDHSEDDKDDRTKNSDVSSAVPDLNPSAMTSNDDNNVTDEIPREDLYEQHNTVYRNSKTNSPNHVTSEPSLPISESSNQIKDDPYNFSEEEDVFSPQLPSRQFSSSNATHQQGEIAGTDSNDPAMERLKAEHRSSGEYDDFDDEMGGDGEAEDPDRLVIADENAEASNRLKQEIPGSGYEQSQAEVPYSTSGMYQSNGTEPKLKGEKPPRKKHNRFNGMSEEEVAKKILPDLIAPDLDILIIGINPGMYAAFKGHHYAGPGNHFWKCMFLSGLLPRPMTAEDDRKLLEHGIGFTNIVERTTKGTANLTRREIEEGNVALTQKIQRYRPKIAVFNGKGIYEIFSNKKEFYFGKQPDKIDGSETHVWVMPNSSARCAQLPRAVDKVPFYTGLKKFRDYLRGTVPSIEEHEMVFKEVKLQNFNEKPFKKDFRDDTATDSSGTPPTMNSEYDGMGSTQENNEGYPGGSDMQVDSRIDPITGKKRRGRPPKPRPDGSVPQPKRRQVDQHGMPLPRGSNPIDPLTGKKKRGRPKKCDSTASQGSGNNDQDIKFSGSGYPGSKRESIDSNESYSGGSGDQIQQSSSGQKPTSDSSTVPVGGGTEGSNPMPLPPFSPNFCRPSSGMEIQHPVENNKGSESGIAESLPSSMNADHQQHQTMQPQQAQSLDHSQKDSASQQTMSSSHNPVADMHSSVAATEYDRPGSLSSRLHGSVDTNDARSHSSHSGHSDYHPQSHPSQQTLNANNNDQAQHHLNSVQQQHKQQQHSQQQQQQQQQHQYGNQYPYPGYPQISSRSNSSGSLTPTAPSGVPSHHTQHYSPDAANGNSHGGPNPGYSSSQHHQHPSHAQTGGDQAQGEQSFTNNPRQQQPQSQHAQQQVHQQVQQQVGKTSGRSDDVTTKSITGLESLVDQIPSLENESGVYSANSGGSQPDTPRSSMGQYSPAAAGYHPSSFHAPGFPVPPVASAGATSVAAASGVGSNHFPSVPSTSDSSNFTPPNDSTNYSASGSVASAQTPTNFSVSSLMHNSGGGGSGASNANATPTVASETAPQANPANAALGSSGLMPPPAPFSSDSFSVSSLTSSYAAAAAQAHDMAKYSAGLANNPYMSSAFGSTAFGAGSFLNPSAAAANSFMSGSMGGAMSAQMSAQAAAMGMGAMGAYYGQYSQAQAAAANAAYGQAAATSGFQHASPYSHGLHMPNPGYPYSPYGQSPYSQSPYF